MWDKRQRGYQAIGYRVQSASVSDELDFGMAWVDDVRTDIPRTGMK